MNHKHDYSSPSSQAVVSTLVAHDPYIVHLMKGPAYTYLSFMDRDDVAQQIRLKMLGALHEKEIQNIPGYLKTVVHNECADYIRRQKPVLPLPLVHEGEQDEMVAIRPGSRDPQIEIEEMSGFYERLESAVRVIVKLPKTQKRVAVCILRDRIDDLNLLAMIFKKHKLDISTLQWPTDPEAKQRLRASYTPVRKKLARAMNIDLALFKTRTPSKMP